MTGFVRRTSTRSRGAGFAALALCLLSAWAAPGQASSPGAAQGRLFVPGSVMDSRCTTRVSPRYPSGTTNQQATVTLRVVVGRSGSVSPMYRVSGPGELEAEAMNAVRLWKCTPYIRGSDSDAVPMDVQTDLPVSFVPGRPAGMVTHPAR